MPKDTPAAAPRPLSTTNVLLATIATVLVGAALKVTASVTLPIVFAAFLIGVLWPIHSWLERRTTRGIAVVASLLSLLAAVGVVVAGLAYGASTFRERSNEYVERAQKTLEGARGWAEERGLPTPAGDSASNTVSSLIEPVLSGTVAFAGGFVLILAFVGLGLLEVRDHKRRMDREPRIDDPRHWRNVLRRVAGDFQKYVLVRTGIGLLTGVAVTVGCLLVGLDLAVVWGLSNFLLNYIPTLGSILGVVPPTLFALVQFDGDPAMVLLVVAVVGGIQLVMGNWVDPLVQGKYLSLSPFVVLAAVTLWGFIWGAAGALIAVPLTVAIVLVCREMESTRWLANLLAREREGGRGDTAASDPRGPTERGARPHSSTSSGSETAANG